MPSPLVATVSLGSNCMVDLNEVMVKLARGRFEEEARCNCMRKAMCCDRHPCPAFVDVAQSPVRHQGCGQPLPSPEFRLPQYR
jgi:hypothetical protein